MGATTTANARVAALTDSIFAGSITFPREKAVIPFQVSVETRKEEVSAPPKVRVSRVEMGLHNDLLGPETGGTLRRLAVEVMKDAFNKNRIVEGSSASASYKVPVTTQLRVFLNSTDKPLLRAGYNAWMALQNRMFGGYSDKESRVSSGFQTV